MKNFILLVVICLGMVTNANSQQTEAPTERISQLFTYRYDIVLHVEDSITLHTNGHVDFAQKYSLEFPKYTPQNRIFDLEDYVGFRIILKYDSSITPLEPLDFGIEYLEEVDLSGVSPLVDDDPIVGGLKPITIPPVDEDDEEGFPIETNEERFEFNQIGIKRLYFNLYLNNSPSGRIQVSKLRGNFTVRSYLFPSPAESTHASQTNTIDVYPNPVQSDMYIQNSTKDVDSKAQITIYTTTGVQLYTSPLKLGTQKQDGMLYHFQNPDVSPGHYYYVINIGANTYTKSLLKK
ncbi:MAG: hypothetical protein ACI9Y7_002116 [Dokdonia sp.]|jgi:hypothetical protein